MTVNLSFHNDTWRVRALITDRPDGAVRVERSTNGVFWRPVRGGDPVEVVDGTAFVDDWEYEEGVENFYRVVPIDPVAGLLLTGADGDYANTPDTAALDITGDIDIRADMTLDDWSLAAPERWIITKYEGSGNQRSFAFGFRGGDIEFRWSPDGTSGNLTTINPTQPVPVSSGRLAVRVTLDVDDGAGGWTARFYTAPTIEGPWSQLGDPVTNSGGGTTSIHAGTATLAIGAFNTGTLPLDGIVHSVEVRDGIDGTLVASPDFTEQPHGTTQFTDGAGRVWTVHGDALIVGVDSDTITPSHDGKIILKSVRFPFINRPVTVTDFTDPELGDRGGLAEVSGRAVPVSTPDQRASNAFEIEIMTETRQQARDMQLILRANPHLFLHTPAGCPVPGGHVRVGTVATSRPTRSAGSDRRYWRLPCRLVAPPSPQVVAGTMTYAGLLNLYGGYDNVLAANPTYADLLELMGSPEDLVVI